MFKIFLSLRTRIAMIVLFSIIPAVVLIHITSREDRTREIAITKEHTLELVRVIAAQEEFLIDGTRQMLLTLSLLDEIKHHTSEGCREILSKILPHYKRYTNFGVADLNGTIICSALPMEKNINISDRKYFSQAIETQDFAVGEYQVGRVSLRPSINFGYPIRDENGKMTSVVFAAMDLARLSEFENEILTRLHHGSILLKVDQNGIVLARIPRKKNQIGKPAPETDVVQKALTSQEGILETIGLDGRNWIYSYAKINSIVFQSDIYVIYGVPEEILLAHLNHIYNRNILIIIAVGVLLIIAALSGFELVFIRQVRSLERASQRLEKGDLSTRLQKFPCGSSELNQLIATFNNMAAALEQRDAELRKLSEVVKQSPMYIIITDLNGTILYVNPAFAKITGFSPKEALGKNPRILKSGETPLSVYKEIWDTLLSGKTWKGELKNKRKDGTLYWESVTISPVVNDAGEPTHFVAIKEDITKKRQAEEQIRNNLKEKEILLRELYHRTKNNIQVISSMLRIKARSLKNQQIIDIFNEIENKIISMALVHQKLYESQDLSHLNLKEYVEGIVRLIEQSYSSSLERIDISVSGEDIFVLLDTAMPCGLIINELITNAIKYAFPGNRKGNIDIGLNLSSKKELVLKITDNGVGLPKNFDIRKDSGLGIHTIINLVEYQLDGSINFKYDNGLSCTIVLKKELYEPRV